MAKHDTPKLIRPKLNLNFGGDDNPTPQTPQDDERQKKKEVAQLMNEVSRAPKEVKSATITDAGPEIKAEGQGVLRQSEDAIAAVSPKKSDTPEEKSPAKPLQRRRARKKLKREHNFSCRSTFEHIDFLDALTHDSGTVVEGFERAVYLLAKEVARKGEYRGLPVSEETLEVARALVASNR